MEQLVVWLPLLIIFLGVVWLARWQTKKYNGHIDDVTKINNEILETNREMITVLKDIKQTLKDQS
jgi:hypothetical protein